MSLRLYIHSMFRVLQTTKLSLSTQCYLICTALGWWNFAARAVASTTQVADRRAESCSFIITGHSRVGKSILAEKLEKEYRYVWLNIDRLRERFFSIKSPSTRYAALVSFYSALLSRYPTGIILEGNEFIYKNRSSTSESAQVDLVTAVDIAERCDVKVYVLGHANATVDERVEALVTFSSAKSCWTQALDDVELRHHALKCIRTSERLRQLADGRRIHYFEVNYRDFCDSIEEIADSIMHLNR